MNALSEYLEKARHSLFFFIEEIKAAAMESPVRGLRSILSQAEQIQKQLTALGNPAPLESGECEASPALVLSPKLASLISHACQFAVAHGLTQKPQHPDVVLPIRDLARWASGELERAAIDYLASLP